MFILLFLTTSCGAPAAAWVAPDEQVYPAYYIPLATKAETAPQTMNGATAMIDWVYVDESRVALHYTISGLNWPDGVMLDAAPVQISSTMAENIGNGAYGGWSLPVDQGVITGSFDQLLIDGTLKANEHPNIALDVDIAVNGTTAMYPPDPVSGQGPAPQENVSLPDIGTFHFELTVPVRKGIRVENIGQTVKDWELTASTLNIGGSDYPYAGGGLLPGKDGKEFSFGMGSARRSL